MPEVTINGRAVDVGAAIATAINVIHRDYQGRLCHDNGQADGPFVAYGFPDTPVQIGVRLNKTKLTIYARERTPAGDLLQDLVPMLEIDERYDARSGNPVHSIKNGKVPYLKPTESPVVRAKVLPEQLGAVLNACLGKG